MYYTCDNCETQFSDNEDGVIIEEDYNYCCNECASESGVCLECFQEDAMEGKNVCEKCHEDYLMTKGCDDYHAAKDEGRLQ